MRIATAEASPAATVRPPDRVGPGPGRPTKDQIEERNRELLDRALDLFLAKGFQNTTIRDITTAVGMAKRTVTLRYGDKAGLFKAALTRAIDDFVVPIERLRAAETPDIEETLLRIARILVRNIMSPAGLRLLRITDMESHRMPEIGAYSHEHGTKRTIAYLTDLFRRRLPQGRNFADAEDYALSFLNLVVGAPARTAVWGMEPRAREIDARIVHCVHLFLHGLMGRNAGNNAAPPQFTDLHTKTGGPPGPPAMTRPRS